MLRNRTVYAFTGLLLFIAAGSAYGIAYLLNVHDGWLGTASCVTAAVGGLCWMLGMFATRWWVYKRSEHESEV